MKRLQELKSTYERLADKISKQGSPEELIEIYEYQKYLDERINYEHKRLIFGLCNTTALFLAAAITLPLFAATPVVPLVSALLIVTITLVGYFIWQTIEKQKPSDKLDHLAKPSALLTHSLFSSPQSSKDTIKVELEKVALELDSSQPSLPFQQVL